MKVLITGGHGQLAQAFFRFLQNRGHDVFAPGREELDITSWPALKEAFLSFRPQMVINAAAYNLVDQAETDFEQALRVNAWAVTQLSSLCRKHQAFLMHFSTDYVFDGEKGRPYTEEDRPSPLNRYGLSKWLGEMAVRDLAPQYLLFRVSWLYGTGKQNFLAKLQAWAREREVLKLAYDEFSVPTYVETVVKMAWEAYEAGLGGLFHLVNRGFASRLEWGKAFLELMGLRREVIPVSGKSFDLPAKRPFFSAMSPKALEKALGIELPLWHEDLKRFVTSLKKNP